MDPNITPGQLPDIGINESKGFMNNLGGYFVEFFETLVVFGAIFAAIYLFVAQFHKVSGNSMVPTFHSGNYLITEKISYKMREPKRGEIIVLKNPRDESQDFIKRIIALPGDSVQISNKSVYLNNQPLTENYLSPGTPSPGGAYLSEGKTVKMKDNQYFVMGDNREHSSDSREWGPISKNEIIGRALFRYFPVQDIGLLINK